MKQSRIKRVEKTVETIPYVSIVKAFSENETSIEGVVSVNLDDLESPLEFNIVIYPQYPFKSHESETIKFFNINLLEYNHVMGDGVICIHTSSNPIIEKKLLIDFESLKNWIVKYYLNNDKDSHYEHLIVPESTVNDETYAFSFTEVDYKFSKGEYGFVNLTFLSVGKYRETKINNYLTQGFVNAFGGNLAFCNWNEAYKKSKNYSHGIFVFLEEPPAKHKRFIITNWIDFSEVLSDEFLKFLHNCEKEYLKKKRKGQYVPLYVGYKISDVEIHWQTAMIEIGNFPITGVKENQKWYSRLIEQEIKWGLTRNASYKYFFGRGKFTDSIADKRILIVGVGAIGSIVAKTLVRCGCRKIDLTDYDRKEPENICRSEYEFLPGVTDKVEELSNHLYHVSPFVHINHINQTYFEVVSKALFDQPKAKKELEDFLNSYDIIFDCTTDNDLMYVLNSLSLKNQMINLSVTNHSKDLVCAFYPNIYNFVTNQFSKILNNNVEDLYNPTGCWSPTFKASYNDISSLVQYALKQINLIFQEKASRNNFVITSHIENGYQLKLKQY
ncbi:ThiF family adenylyltransferase [Zunongwangia endophytica]|uniref:ThiF family adenylyltransferase n=1 Tax=Zunongwangia endophytica TaxID=1808945 RepID=A0ABV8HAT6_9FLAO|nr:ThiF family adenylyltransferase [Zunongwangia endophytica]MDN3596805.1 ThiF family adenylyltransferase [Zunongwangia endophytica]